MKQFTCKALRADYRGNLEKSTDKDWETLGEFEAESKHQMIQELKDSFGHRFFRITETE